MKQLGLGRITKPIFDKVLMLKDPPSFLVTFNKATKSPPLIYPFFTSKSLCQLTVKEFLLVRKKIVGVKDLMYVG